MVSPISICDLQLSTRGLFVRLKRTAAYDFEGHKHDDPVVLSTQLSRILRAPHVFRRGHIEQQLDKRDANVAHNLLETIRLRSSRSVKSTLQLRFRK